jgi:predicted dienelactone hydrolase
VRVLRSLPDSSARRDRSAVRPTIALAGLALVAFAAPGSATPSALPRRSEEPAIRETHFIVVDTRRPTPRAPGQPGASTRTIPLSVRYPVTERARALPLIVLAHGLNGHPDQLDDLAETWARAGFVVATPQFPRTNLDENGKAVLADVADYPGDLSFTITRLLAMSKSTQSPLAGRIDARHVGAAGVSLGGMAVYGLVSNTCCRDRRVMAAILMAAVRPPFPEGRYVAPRLPMMLVHGDADTGYRYSARAYPTLQPPKWFLTLHGGRHGPPFEDPPDEFDTFVRSATTAFWQRYLAGDAAAERGIEHAVRGQRGKVTAECDLGTGHTPRVCTHSR